MDWDKENIYTVFAHHVMETATATVVYSKYMAVVTSNTTPFDQNKNFESRLNRNRNSFTKQMWMQLEE